MEKPAKHKKAVKRVTDFLNEIGWLFGLNNMETEIKLKNSDGDKIAETHVDYKYNVFSLTLYPLFFEQHREGKLGVLIHELCHIFTLEQKSNVGDLLEGVLITQREINVCCERETSKIEYVISRLLSGRAQYAKEAYAKYLE